jgi:DNA-binding transcriptional ArsR family regulator
MTRNFVIEENDGNITALPAKMINAAASRKALSPVAWRILEELSKGPAYPKDIAKKLRLHDQKIYYHVRNLKKAGLIKVKREESINGVIAKYYDLEKPAFFLRLREMEPMKTDLHAKSSGKESLLSPFIENGFMDALIVIGSPDPHGPTKARGRDALYSLDMGLFLGGFISQVPANVIRLDTEMSKDDLKNNLILIGGPGVNRITAEINSKLPIRFTEYQKHQYSEIYSTFSKRNYPEDEAGIIVKIKNPFDHGKQIFILAGRRSAGTRAAILAFTKKLEELSKGNMYSNKSFARVVEGIDSDSDGLIDDMEIME